MAHTDEPPKVLREIDEVRSDPPGVEIPTCNHIVRSSLEDITC